MLWQVYNPATGESITDIACMGGRETNDAISSAYDAFKCMKFHAYDHILRKLVLYEYIFCPCSMITKKHLAIYK